VWYLLAASPASLERFMGCWVLAEMGHLQWGEKSPLKTYIQPEPQTMILLEIMVFV
jgi:hypothetical protein